MSQERVQHTRDRLARLAAHQHGVVTLRQLYSLGFSDSQVRTRVASGWLHRVHRGVLVVGRPAVTAEGNWLAAVLACGEGSILSHQSAAELWGIRRRTAATIDVTAPRGGGRRPRPGITVHRVQGVRQDERAFHRRIPATTPARTVLDLASKLPYRQLERAVDEAERLGLCTGEDLDEIVRRHAGRAGVGALRFLLEEHRAGSTATCNDFEEKFLALCRRHRLPQPGVNVSLLDYIVDFLWPRAKLVVELDGRATHGTRRAFQEDRDRDGRLTVAGYRVLRFTWWDVTRRPAVVADRVRRMLGA
jgi:very-short-patch-repair endonuclease/predicted transcriptional regulator of viral defense system